MLTEKELKQIETTYANPWEVCKGETGEVVCTAIIEPKRNQMLVAAAHSVDHRGHGHGWETASSLNDNLHRVANAPAIIQRLIQEVRRMDRVNSNLQVDSLPVITPSKLRLGGLTERARIAMIRLSDRFKHAENLDALHGEMKDSHGVIGEWIRAYERLSHNAQ